MATFVASLVPTARATYSQLHPTPILSTISLLARRIQERFPARPEPGAPSWSQWPDRTNLDRESAATVMGVWRADGTGDHRADHVGGVAAIELSNLVKVDFHGSRGLQSIDAATSELIFLSLVVLF